jgi:hypothetical protein
MDGFVQQDFESQPSGGKQGFSYGEASSGKLDDPISD